MNSGAGLFIAVVAAALICSGTTSRTRRGHAGAAQKRGSRGRPANRRPTNQRPKQTASSWARKNADHEAAHAGIAHGCGVPKSNIWVKEMSGGIYTGPGPAVWGLHGAQRIAFYLADGHSINDAHNKGRDGWEIEAELAKHPKSEHAALMRRARSIATRHRHSAFARTVAAQVRQTGGFG